MYSSSYRRMNDTLFTEISAPEILAKLLTLTNEERKKANETCKQSYDHRQKVKVVLLYTVESNGDTMPFNKTLKDNISKIEKLKILQHSFHLLNILFLRGQCQVFPKNYVVRILAGFPFLF